MWTTLTLCVKVRMYIQYIGRDTVSEALKCLKFGGMRLRGSWGWKGSAIRKKVPKDSLEGSIWKKIPKNCWEYFMSSHHHVSCFHPFPTIDHFNHRSQNICWHVTQARPSHSFLSQKSFVWPQGPGHQGPHRCCCADLPPSAILPPPTTPLQLEVWALLSCLLQVFPKYPV